ncbi:MAG: hypothetical protein WCH04_07810 [Gammaproteobacteria bacterium]
MLALYRTFRDLAHTQWLTTEQLENIRLRKLQALVTHAYEYVPYYRDLFTREGLHPRDIRTLADLSAVPVTTKHALLDAGPGQITCTNIPSGNLVAERTTGSTGEPFTMMFDRHWLRVRQALFLRALWTAGWRPGRKLALVTAGGKPWHRRLIGWHQVSHAESPESMRQLLNRVRPAVLYGWVTPLRRLAEHITDTGRPLHEPEVTITTAESLGIADRELIGSAFNTRVCEFFGMTEIGIIGWECREAGRMHIAEDTCHAEVVYDSNAADNGRLVMTNLELRATPFLRYETGDLARFGPATLCGCGRSLRTLANIDGRLVDCLRLASGRTVSPYEVTLALEPLVGIRRYRVIQEQPGKIRVEVEGSRESRESLESSVRGAMDSLVGPETDIRVILKQTLTGNPGRKFRVVENRCRPHHPA